MLDYDEYLKALGLDLNRLNSESYSIPTLEHSVEVFKMSTNAKEQCKWNSCKWVWYEGLHMERYWFCTECDTKDLKRDPPRKN